MLRELLEIGSALDRRRLPTTLHALSDARHSEVIRLLYFDRVDVLEAAKKTMLRP